MALLSNIWGTLRSTILDPANILTWLDAILDVFLIFITARVIIKITQKILANRIRPLEGLPDTDPKKQRAKTLLPLMDNIAGYLLYGLASVLSIQRLGVDITAILAGAGVVGLAIGFGAQSLVKDLISGFFLLFDGLVAVGDVITISDQTGLVERIGIRNTQIRKFTGELRTIPNGDLTSFGNFNRGFMRAIIPIGIAYEAKIDDAMAVLRKIADDYAGEHHEIMLEEPMVQGVMNFNSSDVQVRIVMKVVPGNQWQVERDIRRMIKNYFDERNVEIPFPRQVVYVREDTSWDNVIERSDIEEQPAAVDPGRFEEFGVQKENLGMVHQEIRRFQKQVQRFTKKFRSNTPEDPDTNL